MRIHFKDMASSPALIDDIERRANALSRVFPRIVDVRVHIEGLAHHRSPWRVTLDIVIPGAELVTHATHDDPYVATHEAFRNMKRELVDRGQARVAARTSPRPAVSGSPRGATTSSEGSSPQVPAAGAPR